MKAGRYERRGLGRDDASYVLKRMLLCIPILIIVGIVIWYFSYETFIIEDYLKVEYSGYDGKGTAEYSFMGSGYYGGFLDKVEIEPLTETELLSNGDVITFHFNYDKNDARDNNLRIANDECQVTVEGLPKGKDLTSDMVFKFLNVEYKGISPEVRLSVSNQSSDVFFSTIEYTVVDNTEESFYSEGDSVIIRAVVSEEDAMSRNYGVFNNGIYEKEYTVPVGERYLRDSGSITESVLGELDEYARALFGEASEYGLRIFSEANLMPLWVGKKTTFVWKNPRLVSAYFSTVNEDNFGKREFHDNDIKMVYETTLTQADGISCQAMVVVQFTDLTEHDGVLDLKKDSGKITAASYRNSNIAELVRGGNDNGYKVEKLK